MSSPRGLRVLKSLENYCNVAPNQFDSSLFNKFKFVSASEGKLKCVFTIDNSMCNALGTLHGGFSAGAIDAVTTFANLTNTKANIGWTTNMHVSYLNSAKIGDKVIIQTTPIKVGGINTFMEVTMFEESTGKTLVKGNVTLIEGNEKVQQQCYNVLKFENFDD